MQLSDFLSFLCTTARGEKSFRLEDVQFLNLVKVVVGRSKQAKDQSGPIRNSKFLVGCQIKASWKG